MARTKQTRPEKGRKIEKKAAGTSERRSPDVGFSAFNIKLLILSLVVIVVGFIFLSRGSVTLAPILLVLGYCVLVPVAIVYRSRPTRK